ncbi:MAG: hypothetical protein HYW23_00560 [Candidatus Aenigmarchaeota archaeon]|nr:hypothetical protein [Candidatus Aenigmarchaeota archaeon]
MVATIVPDIVCYFRKDASLEFLGPGRGYGQRSHNVWLKVMTLLDYRKRDMNLVQITTPGYPRF